MRGVRRAILWFVLIASLVFLASATFVMRSEFALHWVLRQAVSLTGGQFSFERARGSLSGPVRMRGIGYRTGRGEVRIETLAFDWRPSSLLSGRVSVSYLEADRVRVSVLAGPETQAQAQAQGPGFAGFKMPLPIALDGFRVDELAVETTGGEEAPGREPIIVRNIGLDARFAGDKLSLSAFSADTPWGDLRANGRVTTAPGFPFELEIGWDSTLAGPDRPLRGGGTLTGSLDRVEGILRLSSPVAAGVTISLADPAGKLSWQASADAGQQNLAGLGMPRISASLTTKGSGSLEQWRLETSARVAVKGHGTFELALEGRGDRREAEVLSLAVDEARTGARIRGQGRWRFAAPSPIDASIRWARLRWPLQGEETLSSPSGQVRVRGSPASYGLEGEMAAAAPGLPVTHWTYAGDGSGEQFHLRRLRGAALDGTVDAEGFIRWAEPRPRWNAGVRVRDLNPGVFLPELRGPFTLEARANGAPEQGPWVTNVEVDQLSGPIAGYPLSMTGGARLVGAAQGSARLSARDIGDIEADWRIKEGRNGSEIDGRLRLQVSSLGPLAKLHPDVDQVKGRLSGEATIAGPLAAPVVDAQVDLSEAAAGIPRLGLNLTNIELRARLAQSRNLRLTGSLRSGPGRLSLEGDGTVEGADQWRANLRLRGERFQVSHVPDAQVLVSPDLSAEAAPGELRLQGSVHIPEATIRLPEFEEGVVTASPDVVVTGGPEQQPVRKAPLRVAMRVLVSLGESVRLHGYGFEGRLAGQLTIIDEPGRPALGQGALHVPEGRYRGYGQDLTVERGRFLFAAGPLDNPGLDIRAVRTAGTVKAGVLVSGRLKSPELSLYSDPAMSDAEALAYLLTGRPLSRASGQEGQSIAATAAALKLLGGSVGLEGIDIESQAATGADPAALALGTYLSPRLYIRYAIALGAALNTFHLRYQLTDRWAVETETGREAGIDFTYTLER